MPTILKTASFSTQQFGLIAAIFPFNAVIGATIMGWFMDKVNPTIVINYSYLLTFGLFIVAGFLSSNLILGGIAIFLIGTFLAGTQSSLLPLAAIFYAAAYRVVGVSWMHGIGRVGALGSAFFGSLIFTYNLILGGIFYILSIPTFVVFIALSLKILFERAKQKQIFALKEAA